MVFGEVKTVGFSIRFSGCSAFSRRSAEGFSAAEVNVCGVLRWAVEEGKRKERFLFHRMFDVFLMCFFMCLMCLFLLMCFDVFALVFFFQDIV